jgi:predicted dithiol-disulfide oxidoreductase (DUF899 family)
MTLHDNAQVKTLRAKLSQARAELREALAEAAQTDAADYAFDTLDGPVNLSALFGGKRDLFMIHNMGVSCPNCTMWADGFNGLYPHIADRAAFVLVSPDSPQIQAAFAAERGWKFPIVSDGSRDFFRAMGFTNESGKAMPGVSAFQKAGAKIQRVSAAGFDPDDDFCPTWRLFDMLPEGADGWRAKFKYG